MICDEINALVRYGLEKGLIVLTAHGKVRLLPPLVITKEDIDKGLEIIKSVAL